MAKQVYTFGGGKSEGKADMKNLLGEDGGPISKQEEVFVVRYERGIAYVRRWEDEEIRGQRSEISKSL